MFVKTVEIAQRLGRVLGRDQKLSGTIRFSVLDGLVRAVTPVLVDFGRRYPEIALEVVVDNSYVSLTRHEADVALRMGASVPEHLVGRRVARPRAAVYGASQYLNLPHGPNELRDMQWVRWDERWRGAPPERWLDSKMPDIKVAARVNNDTAMVELLANGAGVGILLCHTGDEDPRLVRVGEPLEFEVPIWVLTHEDLRRSAQIRAFAHFLAEGLTAQSDRFAGL
jgi:DNA-binding transcriptional LysR family regulator